MSTAANDWEDVPSDDWEDVPAPSATPKTAGLKEFLFPKTERLPYPFLPTEPLGVAGKDTGTYFLGGGRKIRVEPQDLPDPTVLGNINPFDPEKDPKKWAAAETAIDMARQVGASTTRNLLFGAVEQGKKERLGKKYLTPEQRYGVTPEVQTGFPWPSQLLFRAPADIVNLSLLSKGLGSAGVAGAAVGAPSLAQRGVSYLGRKFPAMETLVRGGVSKLSRLGIAPKAVADFLSQHGAESAVDVGTFAGLSSAGQARLEGAGPLKTAGEFGLGFLEGAPAGLALGGAGAIVKAGAKTPVGEVGELFKPFPKPPMRTFGDFVKARGGIRKADLAQVAKDAVKEGFPLDDTTPTAVRRLYRKDAAIRKAGGKGVEAGEVQSSLLGPEPMAPKGPTPPKGPPLPVGPEAPGAPKTPQPVTEWEMGKMSKSVVAAQGGDHVTLTRQVHNTKTGENFVIRASNSGERFEKGLPPLPNEDRWEIYRVRPDGEELIQPFLKKKEAEAWFKPNQPGAEPTSPPPTPPPSQTKYDESIVPPSRPSPIAPPPSEPPVDPELSGHIPSRFKKSWIHFKAFWIDDTHTIKQMMRYLGNEPTSVFENPQELIKLYRGADSRIKYDIDAVTKSLRPIKEQYGEFERYAKYVRGLEKQLQIDKIGKKSGKYRGDPWTGTEILGKTSDELGAEISRFQERYPEFEGHRKQIVRFNHASLKQLADSGIISKETLGKITAANREYVAFHRTPRPSSSGFPKWSKGGTGRESDLEDVILASLKNHVAVTRLAYANNMARNFIEYAEQHPKSKVFVREIKPKARPIELSVEEVLGQIEEMSGPQPTLDPGLSLTIWRRARQAPPGAFTVWRDGKPQYWKPTDMGAPLFPLFENPYSGVRKAWSRMGVLEKLLAPFAASSRLVRLGATQFNPAFALWRNPVRDIQTRWIQGQGAMNLKDLATRPFRDFVDIPRALAHVIGKAEAYKNWLKHGGGFHTLVSLDQKMFQREFERVARLRSPMRRMHPLEAFRAAASTMENVTRMAEFNSVLRDAMKTELSEKEAMAMAVRASQEVSVNFRTGGVGGRVVNRYLPFFNASIQGINRAVQVYKKNPGPIAMRHLGYVTIPSLLLRWYIENDPELKKAYDEIPEYRKWVFLHIPNKFLGPVAVAKKEISSLGVKSVGGEPLPDAFAPPFTEIGRPFEYGIVGGYAPEKLLIDLYHNDDPRAVRNLMNALTGGLTVDWSPPVLDLLFAMLPEAGYSTFKERAVLSPKDMAVTPEAQYSPHTPLAYIKAAEGIGNMADWVDQSKVGEMFPNLAPTIESRLGSPKRLQEMTGIQLGGVGRLLAEAASGIGEGTGLMEPKGKVRGTFARTGLNPEDMNEFYENVQFGDKVEADLHRAIKTVDQQRFDRLKARPRMQRGREYKMLYQGPSKLVAGLLKIHDRQMENGDPEALKTAEMINEIVKKTNLAARKIRKGMRRGE